MATGAGYASSLRHLTSLIQPYRHYPRTCNRPFWSKGFICVSQAFLGSWHIDHHAITEPTKWYGNHLEEKSMEGSTTGRGVTCGCKAVNHRIDQKVMHPSPKTPSACHAAASCRRAASGSTSAASSTTTSNQTQHQPLSISNGAEISVAAQGHPNFEPLHDTAIATDPAAHNTQAASCPWGHLPA